MSEEERGREGSLDTLIDHSDTSSIDNAVAFRVHRFARLMRYHLQRFLRQHTDGLTPEQWFVLFRLHEQEGLSQAELADRILNDRPNMTRLIDKLEKKQLVVRAAHPDDRRSYKIYLTKEGRKLLDDMFPRVIELRSQIFVDIDDEEIQQMYKTFDKITNNLGLEE